MRNHWWKVAVIVLILVLPIISFAQGDNTTPTTCIPTAGKICNPLKTTSSIDELIKKTLEGLLKIGIPIVALAIIYSGFLFVSAMGNTEKLGKAKTTLMYTLIGAAILLGSLAIAKIISTTLNAL